MNLQTCKVTLTGKTQPETFEVTRIEIDALGHLVLWDAQWRPAAAFAPGAWESYQLAKTA